MRTTISDLIMNVALDWWSL